MRLILSRRRYRLAAARRMTIRDVIAATLLLALVASGCASDSGSAEPAQPKIMVTTDIWADVVSQVACGESVEVRTVIPPGADPHAYEPSLAVRAEMEDAALVVANGLNLEEALVGALEAVEADGTPVFRVAEEVGDGDDPHVWFDPVLVAAAVPALGEQLITHVGLDRAAVEGCVAAYQAELDALDEEIGQIIGEVPAESRTMVTAHDALGYFAARYGLVIVGTVIPVASGLGETNPARLEELAEIIESTRTGAVFVDSHAPADDAEALARRVGDIDVVTLMTGSLGEPGSGAESYVEFLRANAVLVADALS